MGIVRIPHLFVTLKIIVCSQYYGMFLILCLAKICCLHDGQASKNQKVLLFSKESLSLGKKIFQLRKNSKLKYGNVELSDDVNETHGYHMKCYKKFTGHSKPQREKLKKITEWSTILVYGKQKTDRLLRSHVTIPISCSSTGVFEKTCLFCDRLEFQVNYKKHTLFSVPPWKLKKVLLVMLEY